MGRADDESDRLAFSGKHQFLAGNHPGHELLEMGLSGDKGQSTGHWVTLSKMNWGRITPDGPGCVARFLLYHPDKIAANFAPLRHGRETMPQQGKEDSRCPGKYFL